MLIDYGFVECVDSSGRKLFKKRFEVVSLHCQKVQGPSWNGVSVASMPVELHTCLQQLLVDAWLANHGVNVLNCKVWDQQQ